MTRETDAATNPLWEESCSGFPHHYEQMLLDLYGRTSYGRRVTDVRISIDDYEEGTTPDDRPAARDT